MAELPVASVQIDDEAGALAGGVDYLTVIGCVERNADATARLFSSTKALIETHGYAAAVDYCAMHFEETKKPIIFVALPTVTAGTIGETDGGGNSGTSIVSVVAGSAGVLDDVDAEVVIVAGGTVGTDQITFDLTLDEWRTSKRYRLGTANTFTVPYFGFVLQFEPGTLVAGDTVLSFATKAPRWDQAGLLAARTALVAQQKQARSWLIVGDLLTEDDASNVVDQVNAYDSANTRYVYARAQVRDRRKYVQLSRTRVAMTGAPTLTFAEVGATGDTITRSAGSWTDDGFAVGDVITVAGSASNNVTGPIASLTATVITMGTTDLVAEGPVADCTVHGSHGITFAEVGSSGDTITRTGGSWLSDGFAVGDVVTISTALNTVTGAITAVTNTVMTMGSADLTPEVVGAYNTNIAATETGSAWVHSVDTTFADIDDEPGIDLGAGRARKLSPITGWRLRRPVSWAASLREYQHDVQIPTWRKADGALKGWDLEDADGTTVEHDERIDGGLLAARFTCFRSYANGPAGAFIALSLTRASESSLLSRTHNFAVANVARSVSQAETENAIGQVLELNANGTGTAASLTVLEERVNSALAMALLQRKAEGVRASGATWSASRSDVLNVTGAELTGSLLLNLNGTLEKITTRVRVQTAG